MLPNQTITVRATVANGSATTAAADVTLAETLDGLTPGTASQALGTLLPGGSQTVSFPATTPAIPPRAGNESPADYLRRLSSLDGSAYTATGQVTFTDASQQSYLPVEVSSRSVLTIPVLTLALSGPAVASPGVAAPYTVTVTNLGSAAATGTVDLTLPDGSRRTLDVTSLAAGSSFAQIVAYTPPALAPQGTGETTEQYLDRLRQSDGQLLTTSAELSWRDANGNSYGDIGQRIFTSRVRVPVLELTATAPATLLPSQTATLDLEVRNSGGCTAVLSDVRVTNPDGTTTAVPQFVLAGGASTSLNTTWQVPQVAKRDDDGETDAAYRPRLATVDNGALDFAVRLGWSDPAGAQYGPTSSSARSKESLSIVPVTLAAPATAAAGGAIAYTLTAANVGSAAAPEVDLTVTLPDGSVRKPAAGALAPGATFQATISYAVPATQPAGVVNATASSVWTDPARNAYGPLGAAAATTVTNVTSFNSLVLAPAIAGPNVAGTRQTMTATLKAPGGAPIPNATVQFTVTGANATTGTATTDAAGVATFVYSGASAGTDAVRATSGTAVSNTASVSWITPVQNISTTPLFARFFFSNGSGVFNTPSTATPAFIQAFPTINFNPPGGTIPGNTSGIGVFTRPFTNVTTDLNGNFTGTIVAQGNGLQAGVDSLFDFQAVFTGSFTVAGAGDMVINFFSDDGFVFGVGGGATRVSGPQLNVPAGNVTPFESLPVMGAYNSPTAPVANTIVVHFPAAGSYPYEVDYSECCGGQLALTVAAGNLGATGVPPTGSLKLSPLNLTAQPTGGTQTLTVEAFDGSGLAVANAGIALIVNGPNARELSATTDASGRATFSYSATNAGTDTAQAIGRVAGLGTFSNVVDVPWSVGSGGGGGGSSDPGGNIGTVVTQGWIGGPAIGSTIQTATPVTVAPGVSLVSGVLDYWPSLEPGRGPRAQPDRDRRRHDRHDRSLDARQRRVHHPPARHAVERHPADQPDRRRGQRREQAGTDHQAGHRPAPAPRRHADHHLAPLRQPRAQQGGGLRPRLVAAHQRAAGGQQEERRHLQLQRPAPDLRLQAGAGAVPVPLLPLPEVRSRDGHLRHADRRRLRPADPLRRDLRLLPRRARQLRAVDLHLHRSLRPPVRDRQRRPDEVRPGPQRQHAHDHPRRHRQQRRRHHRAVHPRRRGAHHRDRRPGRQPLRLHL